MVTGHEKAEELPEGVAGQRHEQDDRETRALSSHPARRGSSVHLPCYCDDPADHDWAVGVWRSLFAAAG
jgi:hypothetical protein